MTTTVPLLVVPSEIVVPLVLTLISSGAGYWALFHSPRRPTASAIEGYDEFTRHLQNRLDRTESRCDDLQEDVEECNRDRFALREEVVKLRGVVKTLGERMDTNGFSD